MSMRCLITDFSRTRLLSTSMSSKRKMNTNAAAPAHTSVALKDHGWRLLYSSLSSLAVWIPTVLSVGFDYRTMIPRGAKDFIALRTRSCPF